MSRVRAYALLAWHLLMHMLQKLTLLYTPGGIEQYRQNFLPEGLVALTPEERQHLAACHRCTGCGLCEAAASEFSLITRRRHGGPRYAAQSLIRDLSESERARASIEALSEADLDELDAICPADVPLSRIVEILESLARRSQAGDEPRPDDHRQR
jgi:succinate dehydrogenase/fumarate reductase-like Fe-S protein